jgi:hypothetical protein
MLLFATRAGSFPPTTIEFFARHPTGTGQLLKSQRYIKKKLMSGCNQLEGCSLKRIVHDWQFLSEDMGNDLIPKGEESIFVGFFILMKMERRDCKGIVPLRTDFIMGEAFEIHPDVEHQHVEMQ